MNIFATGRNLLAGLSLVALRNGGWMDLREAGVGKQRALAVSSPGSSGVAGHGHGGEEKSIPVPARSEDDSMGCVPLYFSRNKVTGYYSPGTAVDQNEIDHFFTGDRLHLAQLDLPAECGISAQQ